MHPNGELLSKNHPFSSFPLLQNEDIFPLKSSMWTMWFKMIILYFVARQIAYLRYYITSAHLLWNKQFYLLCWFIIFSIQCAWKFPTPTMASIQYHNTSGHQSMKYKTTIYRWKIIFQATNRNISVLTISLTTLPIFLWALTRQKL